MSTTDEIWQAFASELLARGWSSDGKRVWHRNLEGPWSVRLDVTLVGQGHLLSAHFGLLQADATRLLTSVGIDDPRVRIRDASNDVQSSDLAFNRADFASEAARVAELLTEAVADFGSNPSCSQLASELCVRRDPHDRCLAAALLAAYGQREEADAVLEETARGIRRTDPLRDVADALRRNLAEAKA